MRRTSIGLVAGLAGRIRNGCVALCSDGETLGVCEQERITRVRAAGFNPGGLPDEALNELLRQSGRYREDVTAFATAEAMPVASADRMTVLDRARTLACSAFLPSPFESAIIFVCDNNEPEISVWHGNGTVVDRADWPWTGPGLAEIYAQCAAAAGFVGAGAEQRFEAFARLDPNQCDERVERLFSVEGEHLRFAPNWLERARDLMHERDSERMRIASALQSRLGDLLIELLANVFRANRERRLCLSGSLFSNSYFNSRVKQATVFESVFIPVNPGDAGLALGAAMELSGPLRTPVTPFLGPSYPSDEIKATLDNCKLNYQWVSESDSIEMAVGDLMKGRLVAWFEGRMEWGPRALGGRSILANPFSEYVLDNLNHFLKKRERWRGYALSGLPQAVVRHFSGPATAPFMECDYVPHDRALSRHILPLPSAAVRVQTVESSAPRRFTKLLSAFGERAGLPFLVNTSFNGFQEPIVCNPRDAVRVFFGTGVDTLVLDQFVIRK